MLRVDRADDENFAVATDDLALVADRLDGRSYFHELSLTGLLLLSVNDATLFRVVRADF
jgi:hypothetical protein